MDELDRRMIQLKIEREAVKKEKDEASHQAPQLIEEERQAAARVRGPGTGEGGKGSAGPAHQGRDRAAARAQMAELPTQGPARQGVAELQYGKLPQLEGQRERRRAGDRQNARGDKLLLKHRSRRRGGDRRRRLARTGIPVSKMMQGETRKLLKMEDKLHARGRPDEAVRTVADAIRRSRAGLVGPEPALRLLPVPRPDRRRQDRAVQGAGRRFLFDTEEHLIRNRHVEFMEKHSVVAL